MASATGVLCRTDVFAQQDEHMTWAAGTQWADAFARRERREVAATTPRPRYHVVKLPITGDSIMFTYISSAAGLPPWADPVLQSLSARWGTRVGWDSYRARPTNPHLVVKLLNILCDLLQDDSLAPEIIPLADGGVQAEWHREGQDLEIVTPADEEPTYYYFNGETDEEAAVEQNPAHIQELIGRFR